MDKIPLLTWFYYQLQQRKDNGFCSFPFVTILFLGIYVLLWGFAIPLSNSAETAPNSEIQYIRKAPEQLLFYLLHNLLNMVTCYINRTGLSPAGALALRLFGYVPLLSPTPPLTALRLRHRERRRQQTTKYKSRRTHIKGPFETERRRATQRAQRAPSRNALQRPLRRNLPKRRSHVKPRARRPRPWLSYSAANRPLYLNAGLKHGEALFALQEKLFRGLWFSYNSAQDTSLWPTANSTPTYGPQGPESPEARDLVLKDASLVPEPRPSDSLFDRLVRRLQRKHGDLKDTTPPPTPDDPPPSGGSYGSSPPEGGEGEREGSSRDSKPSKYLRSA